MLSVAILHTPSSPERRANVRSLVAAIPHTVVVEGSEPLRVANRLGCWPGAERAWCAATGDHHLVLEDDAQLCEGFLTHVERLITEHPRTCLSLFRSSQVGRDCSVATVLPLQVIGPWLAWVGSSDRGSRYLPHHDWLIAEGMRQLGIDRLFAEPSLVEHRAFASTLGHEHVAARRFDPTPTAITLEP